MIINEKYYIHENQDETFAIWTIDDMYKMTNDMATKQQAEKILSIMPNSIITDLVKENTNDSGR